MRRPAFFVLAVLCLTGCQASFQTLSTGQKDYDKAYDAVRTVMIERRRDHGTDLRYFKPVYESKRDGLIVTDRSSKKVAEDSEIKLRAVAVVARNDEEDIDVYMKVIKEKFREAWDLLDLDIVQKKDFLGSDKEMEGLLLSEIDSELTRKLQEPPVAEDTSQEKVEAKEASQPSETKEDTRSKPAEEGKKDAVAAPTKEGKDKTIAEPDKEKGQQEVQKENE